MTRQVTLKLLCFLGLGWIWCVEDEADKDICDQMVDILKTIDPEPDHTHSWFVISFHLRFFSVLS